MITTEIDSIIRVAMTAIAQDEHTPESERMCCRHLLKLAIPLLEQARLDADLNSIRNAHDRDAAKKIRERLMREANRGMRSFADAEAAGHLLFEVWGPSVLGGSYPTGVARTGD